MTRMRVSGYGVSILGVLIGAVALANVVVWRTPTAARKGRPHTPPRGRRVGVEACPVRLRAPIVNIRRASSRNACDNRAFPADQISSIRREEGRNAFDQVSRREHGKRHGWEEVGPFTPRVAAEATYTGRETDNSGRVTSLAISAALREA